MIKLPDKIAIDGPAASGKSTLAEKLADFIGYMYFDTGVMYRAVTWAALQRLGSVEDETAVSKLAEAVQIDVRPPGKTDGRQNDVFVDGVDVSWEIRTTEVNQHVSQVSAYQGCATGDDRAAAPHWRARCDGDGGPGYWYCGSAGC